MTDLEALRAAAQQAAIEATTARQVWLDALGADLASDTPHFLAFFVEESSHHRKYPSAQSEAGYAIVPAAFGQQFVGASRDNVGVLLVRSDGTYVGQYQLLPEEFDFIPEDEDGPSLWLAICKNVNVRGSSSIDDAKAVDRITHKNGLNEAFSTREA